MSGNFNDSSSVDGKEWQDLDGEELEGNPKNHPGEKQIVSTKIAIRYSEPIRYIKVVAKNFGELPAWHEAAGSEAWIFVDEIIVR